MYIWAKYSLEDKQDKKLRKAFKEKLDEYLKKILLGTDQLCKVVKLSMQCCGQIL